jgi:hypothetical protein
LHSSDGVAGALKTGDPSDLGHLQNLMSKISERMSDATIAQGLAQFLQRNLKKSVSRQLLAFSQKENVWLRADR